jgi:8-oxo-dGTP pyrophosphatase MutT (NUDIX family)
MGIAGSQRRIVLENADLLIAHLRGRLAPFEPITAARDRATTREAGVLAPIFGLGGRPHLLFTVRSRDLSRHRGEIAFPGGGRDPDDLSIEQTALREAEEELGLARDGVSVLGPLPAVQAGGSDYLILPYVGWLGEGRPQVTPNPGEVAEVFDAPLSALDDPSILRSEIWRRGTQEHQVLFFDYGAYTIWGATGRILRSLLDLLPDD